MLPDVHFSNSVFIPSHQPALLFLASGPCLRWREVTNDVVEQKASCLQTKFSQINVEKRDWTGQSPDLNPIQHLEDELNTGCGPGLTQAVSMSVWNIF